MDLAHGRTLARSAPDYSDWKNTHRCFTRWRDKGIWTQLLHTLVSRQDAGGRDMEWLMLDSTYIKVHPHATGTIGGNQGMSRTNKGLNTKLHLSVDSHGMPVRFVLSEGSAADCHHAQALMTGIAADYQLADNAYDTNSIRTLAAEVGMEVVIPPKANRRKKIGLTAICMVCGIWWKTIFWISRLGGASPRAMPKG